MIRRTLLPLLLLALVAHAHADTINAEQLKIPNVSVEDQDGRQLRFYDDLVKDKVVAINFIFTSCPTVCPPMGANFAALQKQLKESGNQDVVLLSVSIDPNTDTPARLGQWRTRFGGEAGWNLLTGDKLAIDKLLKMLKVFSADINSHAPFVIIGNDLSGQWQYLGGLTPPAQLAGLLDNLKKNAHASTPHNQPEDPKQQLAVTPDAAGKYFGDVVLMDQDGKEHKLYSDLMKDKVVIISSFFTSCQSVCPATMGNLAKVQEYLGNRLGSEATILSISVDPLVDTQEKLKEYADGLKAKPGWFLLSGKKANVDQALTRFGSMVEDREGHNNIFMIGNLKTGLWKKVFGLGSPEQIIASVKSVVEDQGD